MLGMRIGSATLENPHPAWYLKERFKKLKTPLRLDGTTDQTTITTNPKVFVSTGPAGQVALPAVGRQDLQILRTAVSEGAQPRNTKE
jgi:hypothetical protein